MKRSIAFTAFLVLLFNTILSATPGDLDPTFGTGGIVIDIVSDVGINKVVLQPDGKIIVVGKRRLAYLGQPPKDYLFVRRYTSAGALETSFNTAGKQGIGFDADLQPDGKLVVIGHAPNTITTPFGNSVSTTSPIVWRFHENGTSDTSFGSNGSRFVNAQYGGDVSIEVFNTYIVIGYASRNVWMFGDYSYKVSRLSQAGNFDFTLTLPFQNVQNQILTTKLDPSNGDIVVVGNDELRRFTIGGAVVTSFGTNGVAPVPYCYYSPGLPLSQRDMVIQPDGGILVLRAYNHQAGTAIGISRQGPTGAADLCVSAASWYYVDHDLMLQPDGRFFFYDGNTTGYRFFPSGIPATNVNNHTGHPQAIQSDQKLVTAWAESPNYDSIRLERRLLD